MCSTNPPHFATFLKWLVLELYFHRKGSTHIKDFSLSKASSQTQAKCFHLKYLKSQYRDLRARTLFRCVARIKPQTNNNQRHTPTVKSYKHNLQLAKKITWLCLGVFIKGHLQQSKVSNKVKMNHCYNRRQMKQIWHNQQVLILAGYQLSRVLLKSRNKHIRVTDTSHWLNSPVWYLPPQCMKVWMRMWALYQINLIRPSPIKETR